MWPNIFLDLDSPPRLVPFKSCGNWLLSVYFIQVLGKEGRWKGLFSFFSCGSVCVYNVVATKSSYSIWYESFNIYF